MTAAFGGLSVDGLELFTVASPVGGLTAARALPIGPSRGIAVFVPGFTGSKEDFRTLLPAVAALGWEAVGYSQRGQGDSAAPIGQENYALDVVAEDAILVARSVGTGRRVQLVGHSLGGLVARAAAIAAPHEFASVTMLCSGPDGGARSTEDRELVASAGLSPLAERETGADAEFLTARFAASSVDNYLAFDDILRTTPDSTDALRATGLPVLVAHGDADDAWPIDSQRDMAARLEARYEVIPNAGHLPNLDNPAFTAALLTDFFDH